MFLETFSQEILADLSRTARPHRMATGGVADSKPPKLRLQGFTRSYGSTMREITTAGNATGRGCEMPCLTAVAHRRPIWPHPAGGGAAPGGSNSAHQAAALRASHSLADAQAVRTISSSSALWRRPSGS